MQGNFLGKQQYLDAKTIPKFQFQLLDQELINCIKQLYIQSKSQQKIVAQHKKQIQQKLNVQNFIQSLQQIENNLKFPQQLQQMISSSVKNKNYNDPANPVMTKTILLSNKFSTFNQILLKLNTKITTLQKRISQTQQSTNKNTRQKISSVQQQLTSFVKDYRNNFKDLDNKFEQNKINLLNKIKENQTNTIWKINQCAKRLEDRPNVEMVKNCISQLEIKLSRKLQSSGSSNNSKTNSSYTDTAKLQQDLLKLQKLVNFNMIQTQSQIKGFNTKLQHNYISLSSYADEKIQIMKKIEYLNNGNSELMRKLKNIQTENNQKRIDDRQTSLKIQNHGERIVKIQQKVDKFTKNDQIAKILQKIDPHQICRLSSIAKQLQQKNSTFDKQLKYLTTYIEALKSKMQFWNIANNNPQKSEDQKIDVNIITKIIKEEIQNSDIKSKLNKFQTQIIDLSGLKEGVTDILKRLNKLNKDNDLNSLRYEIQAVQQYIKKQILIVNNRINSLEVNLNDPKRRPISARKSIDDGKLFTSVSTKKLLPVSCLSCHQSNTMLTERRTVYRSKLPEK